MPSAGAAPAPLIALGREAVEAVAAAGDIENFRGLALRNEPRDAIFEPPRGFRRLHFLRGRWSRGTSIEQLPAGAA
jgi:hypothetical protein